MTKKRLLEIFFYIYEKLHCYTTVFVLTPGFLVFEMAVVRPALIQIYRPGIAKQMLHVLLTLFCFINVSGNMFLSIFSDCSVTSERVLSRVAGDYCKLCRVHRPPKAWHCKACSVCVLGRDHHCFFFSRCIGLYNRRYYLMYLVYIHISMIYSTYYNYYFVISKFDDHGFALAALRILNPLLRCMIPEKMSINDFYVLFFLLNIGLAIWSAILLWFHFRNALRGLTAHEHRSPARRNWKENFLSVFGVKWYWTIVWPFVHSPVIVHNNSDVIVKDL